MNKVFWKSNELIKIPNLHTSLVQKCLNQTIRDYFYNENSFIDEDNNLMHEMQFSTLKTLIKDKKITQARAYNTFKTLSNGTDAKNEGWAVLNFISCPKEDKENKRVIFEIPCTVKKLLFVNNFDQNNNILRQKGYTALSMDSIINLSSKFDIKGYELLKSMCFAKNTVELTTQEILYYFNIQSDYYNTYSKINEKILKPMQERINEACKDFKIESYVPLKNNVGKLAKIQFVCKRIEIKEEEIYLANNEIKTNEKVIYFTEQKKIEDIKTLEEQKQSLYTSTIKHLPELVQELINAGYDDDNDLMNFWNSSEEGKRLIGEVWKAVKVYKDKGQKTSKALIGSLLKNDSIIDKAKKQVYQSFESPTEKLQQQIKEDNKKIDEDKINLNEIAKTKEQLVLQNKAQKAKYDFHHELYNPNSEIGNIWHKAFKLIKESIPSNEVGKISTWVDPILIKLEENKIKYFAPNWFKLDYFRNNYEEFIKKAIYDLGLNYKVECGAVIKQLDFKYSEIKKSEYVA